MQLHARAILQRIFAAGVLVVLASQAAPAQQGAWTERPYNPPVGSRWAIATQSDANETRSGGDSRARQIRTRAEFTVEEKLADGFRISYVSRGVEITGNAPGLEIASQAFSAMKDIVIRNPEEYESFDRMNPGNSAPAVVWLASDDSKPVTGQVLRMVGNSLCVYQPWQMGEEFFATDKSGEPVQWDPADIGRILGRYHFKTMNPGIDAQQRR